VTYSYDPTKITGRGKDQMRFELGDTSTERGQKTCALSDEEYTAMLEGIQPGKKAWLYAKLHILEAILFKLSYMVDTKIDVLSYDLGGRAKQWQNLYEMLKKEIQASFGVPTMDSRAAHKPPYFHTAMNDNPRTVMMEDYAFPFRRMNT